MGKGEGVRRDAVGPPVVLQHSGKEGFGEKHKFLVSLRDPGAVRVPKVPGGGGCQPHGCLLGREEGEEKEGQEM